MKKAHWMILFILVVAGDLAGIQWKNETLQLVCKPLIVPAVAGYFASQHALLQGLAKWFLSALLFSLIGDVLLLFQSKNSIFFLLGLSAFLLAHIFYIIAFLKIKIAEQLKNRPLIFLLGAAYYAGLIVWLFPYLGEMKMPVCIYGIVISIMFILATHLLFIANKVAGNRIFTGALLFVLSDSVLAVDKFYHPFEWAGLAIMLTYALAQFFIIHGAAVYLASKK